MKIRDLITQDKATLSFEVFPPKKDTDFADVEAAALGIAALKPDYLRRWRKYKGSHHTACAGDTGEVRCSDYSTSHMRVCQQRRDKECACGDEERRDREHTCPSRRYTEEL